MGKIKNDNIRHVVHPYEPVNSMNSRVLVLGSIPSVRSMTEDFTICTLRIDFGR